MKRFGQLLSGLFGLGLFGFLVGAPTGALLALILQLGSLQPGESFSLYHFLDALVFGSLLGGVVGIPFGWVLGIFRNRFSAALASCVFMAFLLGSLSIAFLAIGPLNFFTYAVLICGAALIGLTVYSLPQNTFSKPYLLGVRHFRQGVPHAWWSRSLVLVVLTALLAWSGQSMRCNQFAHREPHRLVHSDEMIRFIVTRYDEPDCVCERPGELSFERTNRQGLGTDLRDGRMHYVHYVPADSLLLVAGDPDSGWTSIWDSLSINDLRRLAQTGATFDTLTQRGYPRDSRRARRLRKKIPFSW